MAHAETKNDLQVLLAVLRATRLVEHTAHWRAKDYGDHLLLARLYEAADDEIDGLGERIVMLCGADAVDAADCADQVAKIVKKNNGTSPIEASLGMEEMLQKVLTDVRDCLRDHNDLSMGMDNFLQGIADTHDSHLYLLRQRLV